MVDDRLGRNDERRRPGAALGVIGLLVAALSALGAAPLLMPDSYDWMEHGTSESAAQGIDGAWMARMGFVLFGLAVIWLVQLRAHAWKRWGTAAHLGFAVSMFGVAACSTKSWEPNADYVASEDLLHTMFATTMGFGFIGGVVAVMVARNLPSLRAAVPDAVALAVTAVVPLFMSTGGWGVLQRIMFITAAVWYGREAVLLAGASRDHSSSVGPLPRTRVCRM